MPFTNTYEKMQKKVFKTTLILKFFLLKKCLKIHALKRRALADEKYIKLHPSYEKRKILIKKLSLFFIKQTVLLNYFNNFSVEAKLLPLIKLPYLQIVKALKNNSKILQLYLLKKKLIHFTLQEKMRFFLVFSTYLRNKRFEFRTYFGQSKNFKNSKNEKINKDIKENVALFIDQWEQFFHYFPLCY